MQSTKSAAKKQELHEDLVRIEQQIRSEKEQRRKREFEKNAKVLVYTPPPPLFPQPPCVD